MSNKINNNKIDKNNSIDKDNKNYTIDSKNPHDSFFKATFGDLEISKDFLKNNLPANITKYMDFDTLDNHDGTFIDEELQQYFSDLLYKIDINNNEGYIYILYEHKSYYTEKTVLQILKYILKIWEKAYVSNSKKLPVVLPVLVYHGENQWQIENNIKCLIPDYDKLPKEFLKYIPNFDFELYDLSPKNNTIIKGHFLAKTISEAFKAIRMNKIEDFKNSYLKIKEFITGLENIDPEKAEWLYMLIIYYMLNIRDDIDEKKLLEFDRERGEIIMSTAEKLRREGEKRGAYETKIETAKNLLELGVKKDIIASATKLPIKKVEELKKEMKK